MTHHAASLRELRHRDSIGKPWLVSLVQREIGGGRAEVSHFERILERPEATALTVSGLDQATFEELVSTHGRQFSAIELWKCPRVEDLSPLEDLPDLRLAAFYWNQRATRLWDLTRTPHLVGLHFDDFTRLHDLSELASGTSLTELSFGDAVWSTSVFESLAPLAGLAGLRSLAFTAKRIDDGRIEPLGSLHGLHQLSFPTNLFTTSQVAWLRAHLPDTVESDRLAPVLTLRHPIPGDSKTKDVLLVGKRKPFLSSEADAARIEKHTREFWRRVEAFRADPGLPPG